MPTELQELIGDQYLAPEDYIPAELLLNDDHPDNDKFVEDRRDVERKIHAFGRALKTKHREMARLVRSGMTPKDIAKKLGISSQTVYIWARKPKIVRYIMLLDYQQRLLDGADVSHRKAVLWRVALDNEEKRPNILIQAIQEINKMSGTYITDSNGSQSNVIQIQINGDLLPRGNLDTMPETFETRQAALPIDVTPTPAPPPTPAQAKD